jgi:hypothetical protein
MKLLSVSNVKASKQLTEVAVLLKSISKLVEVEIENKKK